MSIIELGAIGEFVGSIAVVVSLIFVGLQLRSNTRATQAATKRHSIEQFNETISRIATDSELRRVNTHILNGKKFEELSDDDKVVAALLIRLSINTIYSDFSDMQRNVSDPEHWEVVYGWAKTEFFPMPMVQEYLRGVSSSSYPDAFRQLVQENVTA